MAHYINYIKLHKENGSRSNGTNGKVSRNDTFSILGVGVGLDFYDWGLGLGMEIWVWGLERFNISVPLFLLFPFARITCAISIWALFT